MERPDELRRENEKLRERLTPLSEATLRVNESLDFDTAPLEVADSARALTASRYAAITALKGRLWDGDLKPTRNRTGRPDNSAAGDLLRAAECADRQADSERQLPLERHRAPHHLSDDLHFLVHHFYLPGSVIADEQPAMFGSSAPSSLSVHAHFASHRCAGCGDCGDCGPPVLSNR